MSDIVALPEANRMPQFNGNLRAFLAMSAEEERLSAVIADPLVNFPFEVSAFTVPLKYTGLEILLQPVGIRQRQVWEYLLPLHVIPRRSHVIVPGYHSLNRITDYVDVNWLWQVEP